MNSGHEYETWWKESWIPLCAENERSLAFALAWEIGLDEHGFPLEDATRTRKLAEMEVWLRSLVGRFRVDGKYWNHGGTNPVGGTAECFGIGSGPGVSCVIQATWTAPKEALKDKKLDNALKKALQPLIVLFGVDPGAQRIRMTILDFRAVKKSGFLLDRAVIFDGKLDLRDGGTSHLVTYEWTASRVAVTTAGDMSMKFIVQRADFLSYFTARQPAQPIEFDLHLHRQRSRETGNSRDAAGKP